MSGAPKSRYEPLTTSNHRYPLAAVVFGLLIGAVLILSQNASPITAYSALVVGDWVTQILYCAPCRKRPH